MIWRFNVKDKPILIASLFLVVFMAVISSIGVISVINTVSISQEERRLRYLQMDATDIQIREEYYRAVLNTLVYLKDERTGLCFSYHWGGGTDGGPALSRIACDLDLEYFIVDNE
jgi:hypothetical protein